jgi:hypothetical protein
MNKANFSFSRKDDIQEAINDFKQIWEMVDYTVTPYRAEQLTIAMHIHQVMQLDHLIKAVDRLTDCF